MSASLTNDVYFYFQIHRNVSVYVCVCGLCVLRESSNSGLSTKVTF